MEMFEKVAYLKGLAEGLELDQTSKEGKIIAALVNLVEDMADKIDSLQAQIDEVHDYCEELDEDLGDVEEVLLDEEDDDDFCCCDDEDFDDDCDGNCAACDLDCGFDDEDEINWEDIPVEDDDDLPPNDAPDPAPKKVPTEAEMRAEIQKTRKRGVPTKTIRDYIKDTFGVEASVDCPPEKRQALIDGLANLAA